MNGQDIAVKRIREDKRQFVTDPCFQRYVDQAVTELQVKAEKKLLQVILKFLNQQNPKLVCPLIKVLLVVNNLIMKHDSQLQLNTCTFG